MGVYEWERQCPMLIHADITVDIDLNSINDNLDSTVNYFTLSQALIKRAAACDYQLLEALLFDLRDVIIGFDDKIKMIRLRLTKKGILKEAQSTSVEIEWFKLGINETYND